MREVTLWDLLREPSVGLHFPRFAVFLLLALPLEMYCTKRAQSAPCSVPALILLLVTGVSAIVAAYLLMTTTFPPGERVPIPIWYVPLTASFVVLSVAIFFRGIGATWKDRHFGPCVIRSVTFSFVVYFATTAILTPFEVNDRLDALEEMRTEQGGAEQPATAPESKPEGNQKPKHESEARFQ